MFPYNAIEILQGVAQGRKKTTTTEFPLLYF